MSTLHTPEHQLRQSARKFLVTGGAGFIGSHLVERLLFLGQEVVVVDNLSTGYLRNIEAVRSAAGEAARRLSFINGDVCDEATVRGALEGVHVVLHQAALGSVKRSIERPLETNRANVEGTLQVLQCARTAGVRRVVYASSSSVYGDSLASPKREQDLGKALSPYAATKLFCEQYAELFTRSFGLECIGLRYFNVFGPRQSPEGEYAAVIPRWISSRLKGEQCVIFGDGLTSRDFCYVENVVQANLCAALAPASCAGNSYNIALGDETSLNGLYDIIDRAIGGRSAKPEYREFRSGDVRHSRADISRARQELGYEPLVRVSEGLQLTIDAFKRAL